MISTKLEQVQAIHCLTCDWRGGEHITMRAAEAHADQHGHHVLHYFTTEYDRRPVEKRTAGAGHSRGEEG